MIVLLILKIIVLAVPIDWTINMNTVVLFICTAVIGGMIKVNRRKSQLMIIKVDSLRDAFFYSLDGDEKHVRDYHDKLYNQRIAEQKFKDGL